MNWGGIWGAFGACILVTSSLCVSEWKMTKGKKSANPLKSLLPQFILSLGARNDLSACGINRLWVPQFVRFPKAKARIGAAKDQAHKWVARHDPNLGHGPVRSWSNWGAFWGGLKTAIRAVWIVWGIIFGVWVLSAIGHAEPPPGTNLASPEHRWWECWHQPGVEHRSCCSESDGHNLNDSQWREKANGSGYEIQVEGRWYDVPTTAVVNDSQHCGPEPNVEHRAEAKAWYSFNRGIGGDITSIRVVCFRIGTEY